MNTIKVEHVSKILQKSKVLTDINLELKSSTIYGFVGKNGSGKSMLFRMLSGLIRPTSGKIYVNGKELYKEIEQIRRVGIVIENLGLYSDLTAFENLNYLAKINQEITTETIFQTLQRVGLNPADKKTIKKYSLGMKQKLIIAQAIMEKPDYLFFDEPTNALDNTSVQNFRKIVKEEKNRGALVLLSSHNQQDIELLCDQIFYMENGCIIKSE